MSVGVALFLSKQGYRASAMKGSLEAWREAGHPSEKKEASMPMWILTCPNCGSPNAIASKQVVIDCGMVACICDRIQCGDKIESQQDYSRLFNLEEGPAPPLESHQAVLTTSDLR
jgi:hypothetical protein